MTHKSSYKVVPSLILVLVFIFQPFDIKAQDSTLSKQTISSYYKEALLLKHQNKIASAIEVLNKATVLAEQNENPQSLIDIYQKIALLHIELDDHDTASFYRERAGAILKSTEYRFGDAMQKFIDATILYREKNNFQARKMLDEAKLLSNDKNLINNIELAEANIFLNIEKFDEAEKKLNALLVNSDIKERTYLAAKANLGLAELNLTQGELEKSTKHGEAALEIATKNNFYKEILVANQFLAKVYEDLDDYEKSVKFNKNLLNIQDSLFNIEKVKLEMKTADKLTSKFQIDEIQRLSEENEALSESKNRSEITAILASAFLTIISLLAVSLYRNNQIKLKTNDLLQTKNSELETARDSAVLAMKAKTNFLSTVTHELRTPLYAVTGLTHLLLDENPAEHQKEHLKSLKFSGEYLLNFINDILQINKIDADKLEALNIEFKLKNVLTDVIDSLQQKANENNTKIVLDYDNSIPIHLMGDPVKLSQIIMNLVGNALKFTEEGQVDVITKLKHKDEDEVKIYFEIRDTGIGISEEQQKNIFDSFEQGSVQINREYGGTGLGLTIVKSLLGLFNSKIQLKSEIDVGSSFYFDLDLNYQNSVVSDISFEISPEDFDFEGLHILIVEDNKINQVITKKMLDKKGITCDIANNGNEAIDAAKNKRYDAILMDIHMPGISGEEATIQIRMFNKEIPIIALTAISMDDSLDSFYAAGCNDVVTKPFKPEVFYQKIGENIFKKKKVQENQA
ncbi:ATP-binding protein [Croceitalea sp. MTPC9]|uniref:hybrid sensor histidine kinase/response regulator n=1 Tax=unclassified Croceitalea TaxID=2632280 RepID=UPI002B3C4930|nr:ATP-binding protein [Croceitalea sp. MTPC6]GMN18259.1 ATP-binding protein [Croceitalea sp. MTPC9]